MYKYVYGIKNAQIAYTITNHPWFKLSRNLQSSQHKAYRKREDITHIRFLNGYIY